MLDAEADALHGTQRYERNPDRTDHQAQLRPQAAHQGRRGDAEDAQAATPAFRDSDHRAPPAARELARGVPDRDVPGGVSVQRVEDITEALWGTRVSSATVSKLNQKVCKHMETWRNRPIEGEYPYVYLDGVVLKRS